MSAPAPQQMQAVAKALHILWPAGGVHELRCFSRNGTVSGYFQSPADIIAAAHSAVTWNDAQNVYATINPVDLSELAVPTGVMVEGAINTTKDRQILQRIWIPVDLDVRKAHDEKRSATDAENRLARRRAGLIGSWLVQQVGLPRESIISASSGNGAHLLIRVNLPNDEDARLLVGQCLAGIAAQWTNEDISVDVTSKNAARIWKVYNTYARRGPNTTENQHRMAMLGQVPETVEPCPLEMLQRLADFAPKAPALPERPPVPADTPPFDVRGFVDRNLRNRVTWEGEYDGKYKWKISPCPFNSAHTGDPAVILQFPSGAWSFSCLHNGCTGKDEQDLRQMYEPRPEYTPQPRPNLKLVVPDASQEAVAPVLEPSPVEEPKSREHLKMVRQTEGDGGEPPSPERLEEQTEFSDFGNARRFVAEAGGLARWCGPWKKWALYGGKNWLKDDEEQVYRIFDRCIATMGYEVDTCADPHRQVNYYKHFKKSCERPKIKNAVEQAKHHVSILPDAFDADPYLLNCLNGTLDLRKMVLRPHHADDYLTLLCGTEYDPKALCPLWEQSIREWMQDDEEIVRYLQRILGYCLTGDISEQCFFIWHGGGGSGKTTCMEVAAHVLDTYAGTTNPTTWADRKSDAQTNDLAKLKGKRLVTTAESSSSSSVTEWLLKLVTGGDTLQARFLNQEFFELRPEFKLVLSTNHLPNVRDNDSGIWRRIKQVEWGMPELPDGEKDLHLKEKLKAEAPGILRWMVDGYKEWLAMGLAHPASVVSETATYRADQDLMGQWLAECCVQKAAAFAPASDLLPSYNQWLDENGHKFKCNSTRLGRDLGQRGFVRDVDPSSRRIWRGVGLKGGLIEEEPVAVTEQPSFADERESF